jgi:ABC-type dipeptide/oligopeptide/nickel transport system ATPase component
MTEPNVISSDDRPDEGADAPQYLAKAIGAASGNGDGADDSKSHRDMQRWALQELVTLTTDCAQRETQITKQLQQSQSDTSTKDVRGHQDLDRNYKSVQDQLAQKYEERKSQIEGHYKHSMDSAKEREDSQRDRFLTEFETAQSNLKAQHDQAVWLADSVLEAAEEKASEELARATNLHSAQKELLEAKEKEMQSLLDRYNQQPILNEPMAAAKTGDEIEDPISAFNRHKETIEHQLAVMASLSAPNMLVGVKPYLGIFLLVFAGVLAPQVLAGTTNPQWMGLGIGVGSAVLISIIAGLVLKSSAKKQVTATFAPLRRALDAARVSNENMLNRAQDFHTMEVAKAKKQQKAEATLAREKTTPMMDKLNKKKESGVQTIYSELKTKTSSAEAHRKQALAELEQWKINKAEEIKQKYEQELSNIGVRTAGRQGDAQTQYETDRKELEQRWTQGLERVHDPMHEAGSTCLPWKDPGWNQWKPPTKFPTAVRFGELQIDLKALIADVAKDSKFTLPLPDTFTVPALMAFPKQASLLLHTDRAGRMESIRAMQMVMTRLLTCLPPGRVRFTLIDPVGLGQNFAGFMHLADYDDALIGGRIWTDSDHIDQRLLNLTEHMETVIQKYLRNEFATIDDYNDQAGELAEPYRFLVISDFPVNFSDEAFKRLSSIASTGSRCGVHTLVMRDTRVTLGSAQSQLDDLEAHSVNLTRVGEKFEWRDEVFKRFPLTVDEPPEEEELTKLMHLVGKKAREAKRVEVPFTSIAPKPDQFWSLNSTSEFQVAIGRSGATRLQTFRLGKGVAQHALVAGKTGSGKSTMLHALISNLAMWYSPEEVELYLIDFKKGVEFKTYATHLLPHARAIAVESDREFGLSVLQRLDAELIRRGDLYRKQGTQDLAGFREESKQKMPRTLLIIDEFQEFFTEEDKLATDAALLLDRLVRQGRAFGIHVLLGSQTIGGSSGLSRSTIGQIAVRIALQTSEADSQLILGDGNSAARLLSRPGEAIYNDAGGLVEGNSPFQVAWLPDEQRDVFLDQVNQKARQSGLKLSLPIVFEGNAPADFRKNQALIDFLKAAKYQPISGAPQAWLGEPVAIKAPTAIPLRRQSGANILIIGQNEEAALAMMAQSMVGLAAQLAPSQASFYLFDGSPSDAQSFGALGKAAASLPHEKKEVEYRAVAAAIHELALEMEKRREEDASNPPAIFGMIFAMQRYRALRKAEDSFSFSSGGEEGEKPPDTGKEFADLLREGPAVGIHIIAWIDTPTAMDRALDRASLREFDHRIMFQMSASDSSNLIDSPAANKLGANRALAYSEEQGSMERFRPYALPDAEWLAEVKEKLAAKAAAGAVAKA